jgi:hypothetical protein
MYFLNNSAFYLYKITKKGTKKGKVKKKNIVYLYKSIDKFRVTIPANENLIELPSDTTWFLISD